MPVHWDQTGGSIKNATCSTLIYSIHTPEIYIGTSKVFNLEVYLCIQWTKKLAHQHLMMHGGGIILALNRLFRTGALGVRAIHR